MRQGFRVGLAALAGWALLIGSCADEQSLSPASTVMVEVATEVSTTTVTTALTTTTTTTRPPPVEDLLFVPESFRKKFVELVEETQLLRGLSFADPLQIEAITSQELARRLRSRVEDDPGLSELDQSLFRLLGLIDAESDWATTLADFGARSTPGFYDVASQKLWLVSTLAQSTPLEDVTLVGEIAKALVDQNLGVWRRKNQLARSSDSDYLTVLGGMAEADATLVELLFMEGMTDLVRKRVIQQTWEFAANGLVFPSFLEHSVGFSSGPALEYVQRLYQLGGWDLVNETHQDPPDSTEYILAGGVGRLNPILLPKPTVSPPEAYQEVLDSVWGQWGWNALLASALDAEQSSSASRGWGGDRYLGFSDGVGVALVVDYVGDTVEDTEEMRAALEEFIVVGMNAGEPRQREDGLEFSADTFAWLSGQGEVLTFIAATDVEVGRQLRASRAG